MAEIPSARFGHAADHDLQAQLPGLGDHASGRSQTAAFHQLDVDAVEVMLALRHVGLHQTALVGDQRQGRFVEQCRMSSRLSAGSGCSMNSTPSRFNSAELRSVSSSVPSRNWRRRGTGRRYGGDSA